MLHSLIPGLQTVTGKLMGAVPLVKYFNLNYNATGIGSGRKLCTLTASATKPLLVQALVEIATPFNATTANNFQVGTTANGGQLLANTVIVPGSTGFYPIQADATPQKGFMRIVANTDIYATSYGNKATGTLTSNNTNTSNNDTVTIGSSTYTFKTALTPTAGQVLIGADADASLLNLIRAINHTGTAGTDYANLGITSVANTQVSAASSVTAHAFAVTALTGGTVGNAIATTDTATTLSWGGVVLAGGTDATAGIANVILTVTPLF